MTTFTEDQIKKIRETLGDEAVTKLTLPKVRVPKYVTGRWLVDYAHDGVEVIDDDGNSAIYRNGEGWSGSGYRPKGDIHKLFTIEEWPNGVIYENCPPPERAEVIKLADGGDRGEPEDVGAIKNIDQLKAGDTIKSIDQLGSLPSGSVIARDESLPWSKVWNGDWVHPFDKENAYSEDVFSNMMTSDLTILRVGWES